MKDYRYIKTFESFRSNLSEYLNDIKIEMEEEFQELDITIRESTFQIDLGMSAWGYNNKKGIDKNILGIFINKIETIQDLGIGTFSYGAIIFRFRGLDWSNSWDSICKKVQSIDLNNEDNELVSVAISLRENYMKESSQSNLPKDFGGYLSDIVENCYVEIPKSRMDWSENSKMCLLKIEIFWKNRTDGRKYIDFLMNEIERLPDFSESSYVAHNNEEIRFKQKLDKSELMDILKDDSEMCLQSNHTYWRSVIMVDK